MRIRKNAKLSPLLFLSSSSSSQGDSVSVEAFQTHMCQLNQSPWDVIPFDSDPIQFEYDSFTTANGSTGDSVGAVESVASMMDIDAEGKNKVAMMVVDGDHHRDNDNGAVLKNGSSKDGYSKQPAGTPASGARGGRTKPRASGKKATSSSSTNPYEFYYYSGFGPLWSKRRGDRNAVEGSRNGAENSSLTELGNIDTGIAPSNVDDVDANNKDSTMVDGSCCEIDSVEFEYVDIDDEEEEYGNNDESGKKRTRKPVKARSLKSLM